MIWCIFSCIQWPLYTFFWTICTNMLPVFIGSFVLLLSCKSFLFWMQARFVFCKYFLPNVAYFLVNLNMSFKECELILCVTLARLRYPVIWSKIIMDISVKVFYFFWGGLDWHLNWWTKTWTASLPWVSSLLAYTADFGLAKPPHHMS